MQAALQKDSTCISSKWGYFLKFFCSVNNIDNGFQIYQALLIFVRFFVVLVVGFTFWIFNHCSEFRLWILLNIYGNLSEFVKLYSPESIRKLWFSKKILETVPNFEHILDYMTFVYGLIDDSVNYGPVNSSVINQIVQ